MIDRILVMRLGLVSVLIGGATMATFEYELAVGMTTEEARTMAVNTLVIGQAFYLFNARFLTESSLHIK
ncbi:cation transporting ATPase C-terminal domain-containing protein, partial [Klebsiella pneumoniae]|uniref:cation transporting ATPase C-terminal domain-containing protein n=1 Tax=Klebsiella pneumoniae TaxID=573 RepID=UPI00272FC4EB